ncbi:MAG: hypothetical protein ACLQGP_02125 [Isosphaeraceae bacterium]
MIAHIEDGKPSKKVSRWVVATLVVALPTTSYLMLGPVSRCVIAQPPLGKAEDAKPASAIHYSIDQESAAPIFANPNATTAGFIKWVKTQSVTKKEVNRRLVLSQRLVDAEIERYQDVQARIKKAALDSDVMLARLSVEDVPALIENQPDPSKPEQVKKANERHESAIKQYIASIQLASELGCKAVDFPLKVSGGYQESKRRAASAIVELGTQMAKEKADLVGIALLFRNDSNLAANGNWIADVIQEARTSLRASPDDKVKKVKLGVVLDVSKAEYQPAAFIRDLSNLNQGADSGSGSKKTDAIKPTIEGAPVTTGGSKTVESPGPGKAGPKDTESPGLIQGQTGTKTLESAQVQKPVDAANASGVVKPNKSADTSNPKDPADVPAPGSQPKPQPPPQDEDEKSLVKAIILDIYGPNTEGEPYDVRGLRYFSKTFFDSMKFDGDITLRYRGSSNLADVLVESRTKIEKALQEQGNSK